MMSENVGIKHTSIFLALLQVIKLSNNLPQNTILEKMGPFGNIINMKKLV